MVRWESVLVATFGAIGGIGLGVFLGWALVEAASATSGSAVGVFALPAGRLVVVLLVGAIAGVVAGLRPARRAARLDVLEAIAAE
jgi:putative ABC transport system permease protein